MKINLAKLSSDQLLQRFVLLAVKQDDALLGHAPSREVNALFWKIKAVNDELKSRPGDQRGELVKLYRHPNPQVRLLAAKAALAIDYKRSRAVLEKLSADKRSPQCLDAGMCLHFLDDGTFKPT